ncbi:MAG TPA: reverse transcriptase family protein, partial [Candidatus Limnocylindrales bacterium]|nr:reverse transcriptase family protein [Candidatus Limnocylindrales bacterium]
MEDNQDVNDRYSRPCYYDKEQKIWVDDSYNPIELPDTLDLLHGGECGFDSPGETREQQEIPRNSKFIKYKGLQLKDDLSVAAFQRFKAEWTTYLTVHVLTKMQKKEQLVDRALAGNAKLIASQAFKERFGAASEEEILQFLESKISAHMGVRGKAEMIKKVQQNTREESLINLFLALDLAFGSRPNATEEDKILAAFDAFRSKTLANNLAKREKEFKGNWTSFQQIASEEWGFMGGADNEPDQISKLQSQINAIQEQSIQMSKDHQNTMQEQREQINAIKHQTSNQKRHQQPYHQPNQQNQQSNRNLCFTCGRPGHFAQNCRYGNRPVWKVCQFHGTNPTHTSAQCKVLQNQNQDQNRDPRDRRQDQRVRFNDTNITIPPTVATNNHSYSKYNIVIDSPTVEIGSKVKISPESNLLQTTKKCPHESNMVELSSKEIIGEKESPKIVVRKAKNIKTNSSSPYLRAALEDYYQKPIFRIKRNIEPKEPKKKRVPAKWRDSNSVNSISDIEILKVMGRVNDLVDEQILVDTGARSNVISKEMIQRLNLLHQIVPTEIRLTTANNSSLQVLGKIELAVKWQEELAIVENGSFNYASYQDQVDSINSCPQIELARSKPDGDRPKGKFLIDFIVVEELSVPIILGTKGIKEMKMLIDFHDERIIVDGEYYPFINARRSDELRTVKKVIVPPSCIHSIEIEGDLIQGVYSIEEACQDSPIQVIEAGFTADQGENRFKIWVKNFSREEWTIPANSRIAIAVNPTPIPIPGSKRGQQEDNIQVRVQGEVRTIASISSQSSQPPPIVIRDYEERINAVEEKRMLRDEMITGKNMTNKEREILFEVIKEEEATFKEKLTEEIRSDSLPKYSIKLKEDATPHIAAMGRLSPDKEDMLDTEISDLLKRGLIEYSDGTWRARVVLVRKKDGKWRRCIDYRVLNDMTIADSYPMVRIDETLDQLGKAKYFSKLDMVEGYYQIPLHEDSKVYTGFATRSGFYQWKYLPMGFKNAGAAFQRQMDTVLGNMRFKFCIPYIDDIIIYSQTFEEHINHLK